MYLLILQVITLLTHFTVTLNFFLIFLYYPYIKQLLLNCNQINQIKHRFFCNSNTNIAKALTGIRKFINN